jgi:2-keto-4-pentenoate hydratase/2-oxohepta-3-ene-1,7-dioic acid hydratase in catechol pathway
MKIARYLAQGTERIGVSTGGDFMLLPEEMSRIARALLPESRPAIDAALAGGKLSSAAGAQLLVPLDATARIFCIGVNYRSHVEETHREVEPQPSVFIRTQASVVAHGAGMVRPSSSDHFDFEGELTVVIGRRGRLISQADALAHVAGYTCFNDGSVRDYQKHSTTSGKNFEASGACGPWVVTADELPDPTKLTLVTRLNGNEVQRSTTDLLIHSIPRIIEYISTITSLEPGDIIATGTPSGVGARRTPPLWMKPGDTIEVDISSVGVLKNPIVEYTAP